MIGRFFLGAGLGSLVGTGLLALASVVSPAPDAAPATAMATASDDSVATPEGVAPDADPTTTAEIVPDPTAETVPAAEETTADPAPDPDLAVDDVTQPEALAEPDVASATMAEPAADAASLDAAPAAEPAPEPVVTATDIAAIAPDLTGATAPDALAPQDSSQAAVSAPADDLAAPTSLTEPGKPGAPAPETVPVVLDPPGPPPLTVEEEALLREIAENGPGTAVPQPDPALPEGAKAPASVPPPEPEVEADPAADATAEALPVTPAEPVAEPTAEAILQLDPTKSTLPPAPALSATTEGVKIGRLPSIGSDAPAADPADSSTVSSAASDDRPLVKYARDFDNPGAKPTFAIVLIDDGATATDRAALAALPFPVSFALDPTDARSAEYAALYRAAGQEVVILASAVPKGGSASDIEVTMAAMANALPETVAVMETPGRGFQGDRPLATLVVPVIKSQGRGLLTWDQGLNAADQVARREGTPSTMVFRDLDGAGEAAPVIRRYLDRAAFKAAQEGHVTVVGRTSPDTVAAILEWTVEGRAATVALAPLSAILTQN
ncbi:MAG: divergent polysaccharide deacetylase family protein [Paracoccaceae bacterium]